MFARNDRRLALIFGLLTLAEAGCGLVDTIRARRLAREGNARYQAFDYRGAIQKYNQAIALDPDIPNVYLNLGYAHFSIYNPSSASEPEVHAANLAVEAFKEHLKRNPDDEAARNFQIKTLLKAAPNDPDLADTARRTFLQMLEKNPADHEARQYLITLFIDGKRYQDAFDFFRPDLEKRPDDIETMKVLAIIADKSDRTQDAIDWYWHRAQVSSEAERKALMFYEVGTYAWNLLQYQPERVNGVEAIKLADQGIEACRTAMSLKEGYAEAMVYANLLYLKRALYETEEVARSWDQAIAFELRLEASKILTERKKQADAGQGGPEGQPADGAENTQVEERKESF